MDGERTKSHFFYLMCDFSSVPVSLTQVALLQERDELPIELCGGDQTAEEEVVAFMHRVPCFFRLGESEPNRRFPGPEKGVLVN